MDAANKPSEPVVLDCEAIPPSDLLGDLPDDAPKDSPAEEAIEDAIGTIEDAAFDAGVDVVHATGRYKKLRSVVSFVLSGGVVRFAEKRRDLNPDQNPTIRRGVTALGKTALQFVLHKIGK